MSNQDQCHCFEMPKLVLLVHTFVLGWIIRRIYHCPSDLLEKSLTKAVAAYLALIISLNNKYLGV